VKLSDLTMIRLNTTFDGRRECCNIASDNSTSQIFSSRAFQTMEQSLFKFIFVPEIVCFSYADWASGTVCLDSVTMCHSQAVHVKK
jgi:hypothetical protein